MNIYLLILTLLLPALMVLAYLVRRWKWISNLVIMGATVLFVLLMVDYLYRGFFRPEDTVTQAGCGDHCYQPQYDSILGFKPGMPGKWRMTTIAPGNDTIVNVDNTIIKDTFAHGIVYDHRAGYRNDSSAKEIIFLGCSFTFGSSLDDTATLPFQFGKLTNISTINLGCPAYGLHQVYGLYDSKFAGLDNRNRIFVYSLLSDHFYRAAGVYDWNMYGPYYKLQNDSLAFAGAVRYNIRTPYRNAPYFLSFFGGLKFVQEKLDDIMLRNRMKAFSKQEYDCIFLMLEKMAASITATGGKLLILNWDRSNWGYQGYEFAFQQNLDNDVNKLGVPVIPVATIIDYKDLSNFVRDDGHPSALGNYRIAKFLANKFPLPLH